jgi:4-amino-4-deoxychorismate lyase
MCQLLETIKCKDGKLVNLEFHQSRFENAQKEYFGIIPKIKLLQEIKIPETAKTGLFRCRVTYSKQIDKVEFLQYNYRNVKSLKIVEDKEIKYHFKYTDRKKLQALFEQRGDCDDIIIVKNGFVSDSFAANIVLFDGENWITPDTPLLYGTQRARLLKEKKIFESRVTIDDISSYKKIGLINALNNLEEMPVIETDQVFM